MGDGREYPPEFWGHYTSLIQGGSWPSVEDAYADWQADKEQEWQKELGDLQEARRISSGEQDGPQMSMADDLTAQLDSLARTKEDNYTRAQEGEPARQAVIAAREAEKASRRQAYEGALQSGEYAQLARQYGADTATQIIGRRIYPEEAKTFDNVGKAAFSVAFPKAAPLVIATGDTLRAWKDNEGRGRDAQITAATGALMGDLTAKGLSTVFTPMRPLLRYPGQVASGVIGNMMKESSQRMAEDRPALKDSNDVRTVVGRYAAEESMKKAIDVLANKVVNSGRWW